LHAAGATLALTSRSSERLEALREELGLGPEAAQAADLTDEGAVAGFFAGTRERLGSITALVNVAGASIPGAVADTSVEDYETVWHANVTSTFLCSKHALDLFEGAIGAQVVNVSSVAGLRPNPTAPMYCTAKAAVEMFTRSFAMQVKERGIRVTAVSPGGTDSPFWGDRVVDRSTLMSTDDVVDALMFVLSRPSTVQVSSLVLEPFRP
jgi:NAD(P)-dependent dehydrogenase (short-subunit alcohol dehydrogenase family)